MLPDGTVFRRGVISGGPRDVTQRGNLREPIFSEDGDHEIDCDMIACILYLSGYCEVCEGK
jgi:hypothetical protein